MTLEANRSALAALGVLLAANTGCGDDPQWAQLFGPDDLDAAVLGVWGTGERAVYLAGGALGSGGGPLALRYDGTAWIDLAAGLDAGTDTFWAVAGTLDGAAVMFVGEDGATARYDGAALEPLPTPTALPLFAVWGDTPDDVWAVGGDLTAEPPTGVLLHFDGEAWTDETAAAPPTGPLFGVWGSSPGDVWAVGADGAALHFDGAAWTQVPSPLAIPLYAVSGSGPEDVYGVGGPPATVVRWDGERWSPVRTGVLIGAVLRGASANEAGDVLAVGASGSKLRLRDGLWTDESDAAPDLDLRAAWLDASGIAYAVGGNFAAPAGTTRAGVVDFYGVEPPPASLP